ncbi:hypothetical protein QFZ42_001173 [Variovorax paradoxus]|nr:hypothetical protein [Variovorax paradoxus]
MKGKKADHVRLLRFWGQNPAQGTTVMRLVAGGASGLFALM